MTADSAPKRRLETWKEVATFLRKDERTVKRWEAERGLPIHRLPGTGRSRIFAIVSELEVWRDGLGAEPAPATTAPQRAPISAPRRKRIWGTTLTGLVVIASLAVTAGAVFVANGVMARLRPPPLDAQRQYLAASDDWAKRTPDSLNRAVAEYNAAIALDPNYAEAYAGLASTYDLMREYTHVPAAQAYPLARAAAEHALALNNRVARAHAALAFADYWGFWDPVAARREFDRAIELDPRSPIAQSWYATSLSASGDQVGALTHIDAALKLDPSSPAIASDRGLILFLDGRDGDGLAALTAVEQAHPDFVSAHAYLADYYFNRARFADFLAEAERVAELTDDQESLKTLAAAQQALASGGPAAFMQTLTAEDLERFRNGQLSAYTMATVYARGGDQAHALAFLRLSLDRHESELMAAKADQSFAGLRNQPEFERILAQARPLDES
ncbi:MAG: TPR end-of-group domain-containing protein [Caulobacteraceae bacterium]